MLFCHRKAETDRTETPPTITARGLLRAGSPAGAMASYRSIESADEHGVRERAGGRTGHGDLVDADHAAERRGGLPERVVVKRDAAAPDHRQPIRGGEIVAGPVERKTLLGLLGIDVRKHGLEPTQIAGFRSGNTAARARTLDTQPHDDPVHAARQ